MRRVLRKAVGFLVLVMLTGTLAVKLEGQEQPVTPPSFRWDEVVIFNNTDRERIMSTSVGLLSVEYEVDRRTDICTAFLISDQLVLTAQHCFEITDRDSITHKTFKIPKRAWLLLDYLQSGSSTPVELNADPIERGQDDVGEGLDYMILRAVAPVSMKGRTLPKAGRNPGARDRLNIIHTPYPFALRVSQQNCHAMDDPIDGDYLRHTCETKDGSSGAPIFDKDFNLVGVHREAGFDIRIPGTSSTGVLLSKIVAKSMLISSTLSQSREEAGQADVQQPHKVFETYHVSSGGMIRRAEDGWTLTDGQKVSRLTQQSSSDDHLWVLWDASADLVYQFPKTGGEVKRKSPKDSTWLVMGETKQ
jgi:hypothetical protein